jgi:RND family efflux transporter MFP subunit
MQARKSISVLINILVFVVFIIGALFMYRSMTATPPVAKFGQNDRTTSLPLVNIETVALEPFALDVSVTGTIEALHTGEITAEVSGKLIELSPAFIVGGIVKRGQVLGRIEADEFQSAIIQAESQLNNAQSTLTQERAQAKVAQAELKRTGRSVSANPLAARLPQVASAEAAVKAAAASLKLAKDKIHKTVITAPFSGEITATGVTLGQFVGTGSSLGKLLSDGEKRIKVSLSEDQITVLRAISSINNQPLLAKISLLNSNSQNVTLGRMQSLSNSIESDSQLYQGYVVADNGADMASLKIGEIVSVELFPEQQRPVLSLPVSAVAQDNKIRILEGGNQRTIASKTIQPAWWGEQRVIISSGLSVGDVVVVTPMSSNTVDGSKVRVVGDPEPKQSTNNKGSDKMEKPEKTNEMKDAQDSKQ